MLFADTKAQADLIAADTGLTITGVLSVSASVSPSYGVMPMVGTGSGTTTLPSPVCPPVQQTLSASLTVAYRVR